jgi:gluconate 2-dehydrogenase gamma chain
MDIGRRTFLKKGLAGFGSLLLMPSCLNRKNSPYHFFTPAEATCVIALCEQIIPADEHGGGATEAGVIHYIDRQLIAVFDYDQLIYQRGIAALQATCLESEGFRFEQLESGRQLGILELLEAGKLPEAQWDEVGQQQFFRLVTAHTMQGFYGAPRHGGNKNYMSYQMMGLDFPLIVGRNHYEQLNS